MWARGKIKPYEVTTYEDFKKKSISGDNLEGHEIWQHANLNENGYATTRFSTNVSKQNPVIALPRNVHVDVNKAQRSIDVRNQLPLENISANAEILYKHPKIPNASVDEIVEKVKNHVNNINTK